ncbi:hypothetical protein A3Q56_01838 [Intoshia linei]|uniref:Flavin-containing monooxygenase n=1 Tax=Intoshia linei TaxID=1819745 RepID=A0A177B7Z9_9BILA|nr:hypothetical protein A3Q56_01838 [Intoshia linei]
MWPPSTSISPEKEYEYIILGGGPAGLQMGYEMKRENQNFIILEKNNISCSFFTTMPKHRQLISINKIFNHYEDNAEFNMRHDWNSLLCDDPSLLFKNYSKELFPQADKFVEYCKDFRDRFDLNIEYNCIVKIIKKNEKDEIFELKDHNDNIWKCKYLLVALGALKENLPNFEGADVIDSYATHSLDVEKYKNKLVAILGIGNSAFEVADYLMPFASAVHCYARRPVRLSWDSHFVGDLRAINNNLLDMFHLKSLAGVVNAQIQNVEKFTKPCGLTAYKMKFDLELPQWDPPCTLTSTRKYDYIISCIGWRYIDLDMFSDCCKPKVSQCGRFPVLNSKWMSSVKNMYFIGTVMQQRDKKAASGFIHGFRYCVRSLFSILNWTNNAKLPKSKIWDSINCDEISQFVLDRASNTSALYQMNNNVLCDILILKPSDDVTYSEDGVICGTAEYIYELPYDWIHENDYFLNQKNMLIMSLEDDKKKFTAETNITDFRVPQISLRSAVCSGIVRPVVRSYKTGKFIDIVKIGTTLFGRCNEHIIEGDNNPIRMVKIISQLMCQNMKIKCNVKIPSLIEDFKNTKLTVWNRKMIEDYTEKKKVQTCSKEKCSYTIKKKYLVDT